MPGWSHYTTWITVSHVVFVCLCCRDVIKWLFSAIMKSTEHAETGEAVRERDEQIRWITKKHFVIVVDLSRREQQFMLYLYGCFCACLFPHSTLCLPQNGVHLPEDAVLGSGGGPFSSTKLCQAVPGALSHAHRQYTSTSTQVRSWDVTNEGGRRNRFCINWGKIGVCFKYRELNQADRQTS